MTIGVSSLTTYGVHRMNVLSTARLSAAADLAEMARVGMQVAADVIGETFIAAALVSALAVIPVLFLRRARTDEG